MISASRSGRLPCDDCGHPTCLAWASMVISENLALNLSERLKDLLLEHEGQTH